MTKSFIFLAIMALIFSLPGILSAEDLVGYRVSTSCSVDWDIAVNGATIVRHRPTGFGRCLYSGSVNRAVSNGWNTVSLLKIQNDSHRPEPEDCISIEIDYIHNYTGQRDFDNVIPVINYSGSSTTNLLFKIDGNISAIIGGSMRKPGSGFLTEGAFFYSALALYILFVNIYGFIMVVNDRQAAKKRLPRIPAPRFVWNAILGGGIGTLLGVLSRKHDMDKTISIVVIPAVIIVQFGLVAFALTPAGRQFINHVRPRISFTRERNALDRSENFLQRFRSSNGDLPD